MKGKDLKKSLISLPSEPGVYKFLNNKGEILYIGKATNLKDRVKSYLPAGRQVSNKALFESRGPAIVKMVEESDKIDFIQTDTVLEALIMEANLIKKHQPKYNTKEKDNKSFNYVCITRDKLSKVLVIRGRNLKKGEYKKVFGPFPNGSQLRDALKILRRFFPFFDNNSNKKQNFQFYKQLSLIPSNDYKKNLNNLILFFEGKKTTILKNLEKEMLILAKKKQFEQADEIKRKIFALNHINDVALIKDDIAKPNNLFEKSSDLLVSNSARHFQKDNLVSRGVFRIEAYDIAHLSGSNMVGAFVVIDLPAGEAGDGELNPKEYRTFNIKGFTASNDAGALGQVISRRLNHPEWQIPNLIIADGNQIQKNVIEKELKNRGLKIPVVAVVKDDKHKAKAMMGDVDIIKKYKKQILLANTEVHRFVLKTHKIKRSKNFLP
jgi:excinuclease ABC subunit C